MYQLACHINHNEKLQSNLSGVALESRLIALRNKCTLEIKAHMNIVKNRNRFLCKHLNIKQNKDYDYKDIKALYTPNIPSDDTATADIISKIPDGYVSKDTMRGRFSFVNNKVAEAEKIKKEQEEELSIVNDYASTFNNKGSDAVE
jgi:SPP1 family phage portal protein